MPWSKDIPAVIYINETDGVAENAITVVDLKSADSVYPAIAIKNVHIANLVYTAPGVVIDRYVFHLDNCSVVVVLYKGIVIVARVEGYAHVSGIHPELHALVHVEVELTIGVNREGDPTFHKDERIVKE